MHARTVVLALSLVALAGCKREPDFDERYQDASAQISQSAREIDAQVAGTEAPSEARGKP